jgi:hypothetical protein
VPYPVPYPICIEKTRKTILEATILNMIFVKLPLKAICIVKIGKALGKALSKALSKALVRH